jgi:hypothetical protein
LAFIGGEITVALEYAAPPVQRLDHLLDELRPSLAQLEAHAQRLVQCLKEARAMDRGELLQHLVHLEAQLAAVNQRLAEVPQDD